MTLRLCMARALVRRYNHCLYASFGTTASRWVKRFLTPNEEKELYMDITESFREKLAEKKNANEKMYSSIFDQVLSITFKSPLSESEANRLKHDLDKAGLRGDIQALDTLRQTMDKSRLGTPMYNRLIRSYIMTGDIEKAEDVLASIEDQSLSRSTRSFTYLINAYVQSEQLDKACEHIAAMQRLSLMKSSNEYDYRVLMKYYAASGLVTNVEAVWEQVQQDAKTIKPGIGIYSLYMHWLLQKGDTASLANVATDLTRLRLPTANVATEHTKILSTTVQALVESNKHCAAEALLIYLAQLPSPHGKHLLPKETIERMIMNYIANEQDLKAISFFYRLQKTENPNATLSPGVVAAIQCVVDRLEAVQGQEHRQDDASLGRLKEVCELKRTN